jgi:hypothetical protein
MDTQSWDEEFEYQEHYLDTLDNLAFVVMGCMSFIELPDNVNLGDLNTEIGRAIDGVFGKYL